MKIISEAQASKMLARDERRRNKPTAKLSGVPIVGRIMRSSVLMPTPEGFRPVPCISRVSPRSRKKNQTLIIA